ncbi:MULTISPECIES: monofunctional biosynthetic peptidoglycan transglycosylase [Shimia]|uniref:monofunctional biosynthetic peptidoglycan transglycosylase n=1 Tax=Shimia TaxID=573139 RepID=UPI001FB3659D|nr:MULTISPECIES: monofunctional biosynthetic peptidoglycan transglycosylase [Shimia]MDV4144578.1 monofunctional biosynthetic peptidoglycan transglycosylase [Shimia sp. FJ5]
MAKSKTKKAKRIGIGARLWGRVRRPLRQIALWSVSILILSVLVFRIINPPTTITILSEKARLGEVDREWVAIEEVAPVLLRSVVAAEDANFCLHWGFDVQAIKAALAEGSGRGASTLSQQTVKNVYLWQGRSWLRKALEALITPLVEIAWTKKRILEVYVNVAEFDEGVFGIEAAARHHFGVGPDALTPVQAARLAAVLPSPKRYSAVRPGNGLRARSAQILDGAETIRVDGRADCFAGGA